MKQNGCAAYSIFFEREKDILYEVCAGTAANTP